HSLAPFGNHSRSEAYNHQHQNNLDGDGNHAEERPQPPRHDIAPEHLHQGERPVEGLVHFLLSPNCITAVSQVKRREIFFRSNLRGEFAGKYFCRVKFSTQVLISLWKRTAILS